jgi:uncharacterized protein YndB with AHSA1/START domain
MTEFQPITIEIIINAPVSRTWQVLTEPEKMKQWMYEEPLEITTNWKVGGPILIKGKIHEVYFENTGRVIQFEPHKVLSYEHLNSLSELPDEPTSYSVLEFELQALNRQTHLKLTLRNFPTESIYKHLKFYWETTFGILKKFTEALEQE